MWMNLKVKSKLLILVTLAAITLVMAVTAGIHKMRSMSANEEEISIAVKHVSMLNNLRYQMTSIRLDILYMLILNDPAKIQEREKDIARLEQGIQEGVAAFLRYDIDGREKELLAAFQRGWDAYRVEAEKVVRLARESAGESRARAETVQVTLEKLAPLAAQPRQAIEDLVKYNVDEAALSYQKDLAGYRSSLITMTALAALTTAFLFTVGLLIARSISNPLRKVLDTLARVASGDLTARSDIRTRDEMGHSRWR